MYYLANIIHIIKSLVFSIKFIEYLFYKYFSGKYNKFLELDLNENSIVIDIGANVGTLSQFIINNYNCNVICYEPNKYAYKILKKRFKKIKKVECHNIGVSENNTQKKIFFHKYHKINKPAYSSASSLLEKKNNVDPFIFETIETISIKNILEKYDFIDLIKIDIEGYEYKILPEIIKNKKKIKKVFCELHGNPKYSKDKFLNDEYKNFKKKIKKLNLNNNWFFEHF